MKQRIESACWQTRWEKNSQKEQEKEKRLKKNEQLLRELQDNLKRNNIHIIDIPEGEEDQGIENLSEKIMMENFPNLMREKGTKIQETERIPIKRNPKRPTSRNIIIKMAKFQENEIVKYGNEQVPINNHLKRKWIKCPNKRHRIAEWIRNHDPHR